jgi:hypothetical protein
LTNLPRLTSGRPVLAQLGAIAEMRRMGDLVQAAFVRCEYRT